MSSDNLWLNSHASGVKTNDRAKHRELTRKIKKMFTDRKISPEEIAGELGIPSSRARNWYFRSTRITALDLLRLGIRFVFVREYVMAVFESARDRVSSR
jgi:hypothetical protein